jgi:cytochrome P450
MWELCEHPEWIDILRKEVISLVTEMGWTRQTLAKMDLMDAFFKETQTYIRGPLTTVRRYVEKDLLFHDGLTIRKGRRFFLMPLIRIDEQGDFDPYRWVKRRETSDDPKGLLFVASGLESQTFGLGKHACPGYCFLYLSSPTYTLPNPRSRMSRRSNDPIADLFVVYQTLLRP